MSEKKDTDLRKVRKHVSPDVKMWMDMKDVIEEHPGFISLDVITTVLTLADTFGRMSFHTWSWEVYMKALDAAINYYKGPYPRDITDIQPPTIRQLRMLMAVRDELRWWMNNYKKGKARPEARDANNDTSHP